MEVSEDFTEPLPWHRELWQQLMRQLQQGRLGHAILLRSMAGLGQEHFARRLVWAYLCQAGAANKPCLTCKSCQLLAADSHPDFHLVQPAEPGKAIRIESIRTLMAKLEPTAQQGRGKAVLLQPADAMNLNAANALLKTLEEPPGDALMVLVSSQPARLPATVRSRCHQVELKMPPRGQALAWLEARVGESAATLLARCHGAPVAAFERFQSNQTERDVQLTETLMRLSASEITALDAAAIMLKEDDGGAAVDHLLYWLHRVATAPYRSETDMAAPTWFEDLLASLPRQWLFRYLDKVTAMKRFLVSSANPNRQLILEELMMDWVALLQRPATARSDGRKRILL